MTDKSGRIFRARLWFKKGLAEENNKKRRKNEE
jgi:hypothetical protein